MSSGDFGQPAQRILELLKQMTIDGQPTSKDEFVDFILWMRTMLPPNSADENSLVAGAPMEIVPVSPRRAAMQDRLKALIKQKQERNLAAEFESKQQEPLPSELSIPRHYVGYSTGAHNTQTHWPTADAIAQNQSP